MSDLLPISISFGSLAVFIAMQITLTITTSTGCAVRDWRSLLCR
jgi:hypothetical protein